MSGSGSVSSNLKVQESSSIFADTESANNPTITFIQSDLYDAAKKSNRFKGGYEEVSGSTDKGTDSSASGSQN